MYRNLLSIVLQKCINICWLLLVGYFICQKKPHTVCILTYTVCLYFFFLGNITDGKDGLPNSNFYWFDFTEEVINWETYTVDQLVPAQNPTNTPNPPSTPSPNPNPSPNPSHNTSIKTATNSPSSSNEPSQANQTNTSVIVGLSVGLGTIAIASIVAFTLIYRRMKKNKNATTEFDPRGQPVNSVLELPPSSVDKYHPTMNQQYSPVNQQYFVNQQQYPVNQQYSLNQQNPVNQQYLINQQYPVNQQYSINQQYPVNQQNLTRSIPSNYSDSSSTLTFTQSQGHSPGQGTSNLQASPQERNSVNSSNLS
jgi:hypothetical protein